MGRTGCKSSKSASLLKKSNKKGMDVQMKKYDKAYDVKISNIKIKDNFWSAIQNLIVDEVIPYQEKILNDEILGIEKSHAITNFRIAAGLEEGEFYGMVFQDSDVAKWLEGVAYSLSIRKDEELEKRADNIIDIIGKAQEEDGYLNTYFTLKEPDHKWENLQECHELYCAGHMMEAAAAYYESTGKTKLLHIMEKFADHIDRRFGEGKELGVPGHQEIEVGLMRLYKVTGNEKYKEMASYFIEERGKNPDYFIQEREKRKWIHFDMDPENREYSQSHAPVREQEKAVGHSVRAVYMYMAMADLAMEMQDETLYAACLKLWNNITNKRMYITGGIGSTVDGEAFTMDYNLPNDTAYAETCASIAMVMFAKRMADIEADGRYADVMEKELYNGILSGMQLDGKAFFYVNPLEVNIGISGKLEGFKHVLPRRPKWYACSCCPTNTVRLLTSLGTYAWTEKEDIIYSHLYIGQTAELTKASIQIESKYPWYGDVSYTINPKNDTPFTVAIHIPSGIDNLAVELNGEKLEDYKIVKGYLYIDRTWKEQDCIQLRFDLKLRKVYANPKIRANSGCVAIMRGPVVYCFEQEDLDHELQTYRIIKSGEIKEEWCAEGILKNMMLLEIEGMYLVEQENLYGEEESVGERANLKAIPYFAWANRSEGNMRVWMPECIL